ncbi:MAG: AAA family ATPase, partial [Deltaproteobacteria bacterium]|nr:AAA family ATPase [Deltaproteobacteria bacterium]
MTEKDNTDSDQKMPKRLLPESPDFLDFIGSNAVYVDKTAMIRDLLNSSPTRTFFLSRPRRFGKTLLLDTIQNIATGNKKPFADLDIGKGGPESDYNWTAHPVIRISLGGFPSAPVPFRDKILSTLNEIAKQHNLNLGPASSVSDIDLLISRLSERNPPAKLPNMSQVFEQEPANVILLIDEYDYPLLSNLNEPAKAEETRELLRDFYSTIKRCRKMLRFTFITGITKFSQLSIFSGINNIIDISLEPHYSTICGFTKKEIKLHFSSHIGSALSYMKRVGRLGKNSTKKIFMDLLKFWYDGYTWDGKKKVFNPFSITNCLYKKEFNSYWYDSGTSIAAYKFKHNPSIYIDIFSKKLRVDSFRPINSLQDLKIESLLFHTGYLTIDKIENSGIRPKYALKCPNNEISFALANDFGNMDSPFPGFKGSISEKYIRFLESFERSDENECSRLFSSLLRQYAICLHNPNEFIYQFLLYVLLNLDDCRARLEQFTGDGRADIVYTSPSGFQVVIEIKRTKVSDPKNFNQPSKPPVSGSILPASPEVSEHVRKHLEDSIAGAVSQILAKNYLSPFYLKGETRVCAVAVHGWTHSMFRFYKVDWNAKTVQDPVPIGHPE